MIVVLPYNRNLKFNDNIIEQISIIKSCGIQCDGTYYLGGGSPSGLKWEVGDDQERIIFLLLKTGGVRL